MSDLDVGVQGVPVGRHEGAVEAHAALYHLEQVLPPVEGVLPHLQVDLPGRRRPDPLQAGVGPRDGLKKERIDNRKQKPPRGPASSGVFFAFLLGKRN